MCIPDGCGGLSTPFRIRANSRTTSGPRTRGNIQARPTNWAGFALDENAGSSMSRPVRRSATFTAAIAAATICSQTACSLWMRQPANVLWHFQTTHHDVWDVISRRPVLRPCSTTQARRRGGADSKQGYVYVFDRVTGVPLFPVEERPFPPSTVPAKSLRPPSPCRFSQPCQAAAHGRYADHAKRPKAHAWALQQFRSFRSDVQFRPFGVDRPTVNIPRIDGGAEWAACARSAHRCHLRQLPTAWRGPACWLKSTPSSGVGASHYQCSVRLPWIGSQGIAARVSFFDRYRQALIERADRRGDSHRRDVSAIQGAEATNPRCLVTIHSHGPRPDRGQSPCDGAGSSTPGAGAKQKCSADRDLSRTSTSSRATTNSSTRTVIRRSPAVGDSERHRSHTGKYLWKIPLASTRTWPQWMKNTGSENYADRFSPRAGFVIGATIYDRSCAHSTARR